jgi:hypothetical protein
VRDPDYIDPVGLRAWVAEHTDLPLEIVGAVLGLEFEFMVAAGIVEAPGYDYFPTYQPEVVAGVPPEVALPMPR